MIKGFWGTISLFALGFLSKSKPSNRIINEHVGDIQIIADAHQLLSQYSLSHVYLDL